MDNRKTALVLGGGGSRGAYEIGVWQALKELGIRIDIVTGTSVGAINGAMIAQDTFDLAVSLWKEIDTSKVFDTDIKDIIANSGIGTAKLKDLLYTYIDESAIRKSSIDYGLVVVELPSMRPKYLIKEEIPEGTLIDHIMASGTLFPAMKTYEINSLRYIDGGFSDNLPVGMAVDHGATHVIAVDLEVIGVIRKKRFDDADFIRIIQCPWDLGNMLIFDTLNTSKILRLGYLDTLKAFHVYDGNHFCFVKGDFDRRSLRGADSAGTIFGLDAGLIYKKYIFDIHLKNAVDKHIKEIGKEPHGDSETMIAKLLDGIIKAKATLNQKTLTIMISRKLKESRDIERILLAKPVMNLLKEETLAANYLIKEGFI
ncbi:MAG: patatin-like phospholipase family protein [Eubacteriales bacterium]|nr:patatin-like phospholipase family protein [Eubacteriales bacterium]MDD3199178.1 patatin-like phospholipase family protein [Eubacteriales bacterium]MDD4121688.1 patatin-like phospholipase family protein [Eubacteriales bacterium]MDD4629167.1 patatin-like phospholipase family protein [Eubacteriales bacterium]